MPKSKVETVEAQIIEQNLSKVTSQPKPARRRVQMTVPLVSASSSDAQETVIHDAVSEAVSGVMPLSTTLSSVPDHTTVISTSEFGGLSAISEKQSSQSLLELEQQKLEDDSTPENKTPEDTMFGDKQQENDDAESIGEEIAEELEDTLEGGGDNQQRPVSESESEPLKMESDSEGVMMMSTGSIKKKKASKPNNLVTVVISHLSLDDDCEAMKRDEIQLLFVEYKFLGLDPQETETPFPLPKPKPFQQITYNFSKTIQVDMDQHYERRQYLASMLLPDDPEDGKIKFTLVSEPPEDDQDGECEDVGVTYVSIRDILRTKKDIKDQELDILDVNNESNVIGQMNITVICLAALEAIEREMQVDGTF